jgi:hypothetical protein
MPSDLDNYVRMIQTFNICHLYFPNDALLEALNRPDHFIHSIIGKLYDVQPVTLPLTFDLNAFGREFIVTVENYNTMCNSGFQINREVFTRILNDVYKKRGLISSAKFEPSNYQGINAKYISRIHCSPQCTSLGKKKNTKCRCKEISFLIFQEGNIIITGGRSWEQITDGYKVIMDILKDEYGTIAVTNKPLLHNTDDLPSQIFDSAPDGTQLVYLNKRKQITENPRNVFLLKKLGIFKDYL